MSSGQDGQGQRYTETDLPGGDKLRVTLVPVGWTGGRCLRFQVREAGGRLRKGPEVPLDKAGEVVRGVVELLV